MRGSPKISANVALSREVRNKKGPGVCRGLVWLANWPPAYAGGSDISTGRPLTQAVLTLHADAVNSVD